MAEFSTLVALDAVKGNDGACYVEVKLAEEYGAGDQVSAFLTPDQARALSAALAQCAHLTECGATTQ